MHLVLELTIGNLLSNFLLFFIHVMVEKVLFLGQIFEMETFDGFTRLRSPKSENHIFNGLSVCVYVCVCLCECYQHNSKTNNNKNIKFGIQHLYHVQMRLEIFYKDRTKFLRTRHSKNSNTLMDMEGIFYY